ncbi:hypothetical protein HOLleu_44338 [Holothuria leucospilota]|uniref:Uncharacterized protein n=1 Tax=Holothuria leucospilota TaxID=206669 RepID=A0A9Q0YFY8_HOLLE|nr:hypothetical protein HOLleu_44338 [Holothuria leucospilota]
MVLQEACTGTYPSDVAVFTDSSYEKVLLLQELKWQSIMLSVPAIYDDEQGNYSSRLLA